MGYELVLQKRPAGKLSELFRTMQKKGFRKCIRFPELVSNLGRINQTLQNFP